MPFPWAELLFSRQTLFWLLLYASLWWLLAGGQGWYIGVPCVVAAAMLSRWLDSQARPIRFGAFPGFVLFYLRALVAGGWDVAHRAVLPRMDLNPTWVRYRLSIRQPHLRMLLASLIGLLPGTLAAAVDGDWLIMHVLDSRQDWSDNTAQLEERLLRLIEDVPP